MVWDILSVISPVYVWLVLHGENTGQDGLELADPLGAKLWYIGRNGAGLHADLERRRIWALPNGVRQCACGRQRGFLS